ncbi:carbohydrate porin [Nitrospirillum viridazoti]|uniref:carbohydrate porin n=1 Tax=Nitrospirillum viridazoti TaxID=3144925 RepID=UPI001300C93C
MVGWTGATFHMSINDSIGTSLAAEHTLNAVSFQTRFKTYHNMRLSALSLDQDLFDGKINITGGRVNRGLHPIQEADVARLCTDGAIREPAGRHLRHRRQLYPIGPA